MKTIILVFSLLLSFSSWGARPNQMICADSEFGAGHFKMIIPDISAFFYPYNTPNPRGDQRPIMDGEFWIKGIMYSGVFERPIFVPDWEDHSGWYKTSSSPFEFSLCGWKKCPVRKIKLMVYTKDQLKAEGSVTFLFQVDNGERVTYERKLNCELK